MKILRDNKKLKIRVFLDVVGWPADRLNPSLKDILKSLAEKMNWAIISEEYAEPEKIGEKMHASHVEFEAEVPGLPSLFIFCVAYAPSAVEIISPAEFYVTAGEMQDIMADINGKVREMDKEIKLLGGENLRFKHILNTLESKGIIKKMPQNEENAQK